MTDSIWSSPVALQSWFGHCADTRRIEALRAAASQSDAEKQTLVRHLSALAKRRDAEFDRLLQSQRVRERFVVPAVGGSAPPAAAGLLRPEAGAWISPARYEEVLALLRAHLRQIYRGEGEGSILKELMGQDSRQLITSFIRGEFGGVPRSTWPLTHSEFISAVDELHARLGELSRKRQELVQLLKGPVALGKAVPNFSQVCDDWSRTPLFGNWTGRSLGGGSTINTVLRSAAGSGLLHETACTNEPMQLRIQITPADFVTVVELAMAQDAKESLRERARALRNAKGVAVTKELVRCGSAGFVEFDVDGDGNLNRRELRLALAAAAERSIEPAAKRWGVDEAKGRRPDRKALERLLAVFDSDEDGLVSREEFVSERILLGTTHSVPPHNHWLCAHHRVFLQRDLAWVLEEVEHLRANAAAAKQYYAAAKNNL
eukprot:SAG31_NODE_6256_length_2101_cov_1.600400_2_plen_431_part_01